MALALALHEQAAPVAGLLHPAETRVRAVPRLGRTLLRHDHEQALPVLVRIGDIVGALDVCAGTE